MKNKKLEVTLLTLAAFTTAQGVYEPKTPWPLAPVEDAVVGTAGVLTLGQTDADPSALPMTVVDAVPGVSYARTKDSCGEEKHKSKKKRTKKETSSINTSRGKKTIVKKTKSQKNNNKAEKIITAPVTVPAAIAADIVTLDTQHFTKKTVDSLNENSDECVTK